MTTTSPYVLDNADAEAGGRFDALEALFNPITFGHFDRLGVSAGWRCWEVGAGGPSVPAWLAVRAGSKGRVLATDLDTSWLGEDDDRSFDVLQHDVAHDEPPAGEFDLVHARLVLVHVPDREQALERMVRSLRPGGWLLIEDFDPAMQPLACPDPVGDIEHVANRVRAGFVELLGRRGVDLEYGRKLPRILRQAGLQHVAAAARFEMTSPTASDLEIANTAQTGPALVESGLVTAADVDAYLDALRQGQVEVVFPPFISAWGQRPLP